VRVHKRAFARTIRTRGDLTINCQDYYVSRTLAGQRVTCWVNAAEKHFEIWQPGKLIKSIPIKGWYEKTMLFGEYVELMRARGALRISTVCAHPSSAESRAPVGLNLKSAQRTQLAHAHHEFPARGGISRCLQLVKRH
jgi:hypothetical protein